MHRISTAEEKVYQTTFLNETLCELMPYLAAIATKEWCFKEERVLNTILLEFCILCQNVSLLWSVKWGEHCSNTEAV